MQTKGENTVVETKIGTRFLSNEKIIPSYTNTKVNVVIIDLIGISQRLR